MSPDPLFLKDFLEAVARQRGSTDPDFMAHVTLRLEHGGKEYGDSYRERTLQSIFYEVREEAADIPAWLALALERIFEAERSGEIDSELAHLARLKLMNWAAASQWLWRELTDFLDQLGPTSS